MIRPDDVLGLREAAVKLGRKDRRDVLNYVRNGRLKPLKRLPGERGALLFLNSDVEHLADELRQELTDKIARLDAARNAS